MKNVLMTLVLAFVSLSAFAKTKEVLPVDSPSWRSMADVSEVHSIESTKMNVKIFSYVGDAALNGNYVVLAVMEKETQDWNVFQLANTAEYKVLPSKKDGYLKIQLKTQRFTDGADYEIEYYNSILYVDLATADQKNGKIYIEEVR